MPGSSPDPAAKSGRRFRSTSPGWVLGFWLVMATVSIGAIVSINRDIAAYDAAHARATPGFIATVTGVNDGQPDTISINWQSTRGLRQDSVVEVNGGSHFRVGEQVAIRVTAGTTEVFLEDIERARRRVNEGGIIMTVAILILVGLPWLLRALRWWHAARAPARRLPTRVGFTYNLLGDGVPWLAITDGDRTYFQRAMWEPWVAEAATKRLTVDVRRSGRRGPFVADVHGFGRLWPAGRARSRPPRADHLELPRPSSDRQSRAAMMAGCFVVVGLTAIGGGPGAAILAGSYVCLIGLYVGGPPLSFARRRKVTTGTGGAPARR